MADTQTDARFETIRWYLDRRDDAAGWVALESVEAELAFDHRARLELEAELAQVKDAAESALRRYEAHDDGTLNSRPGLAWAMASDLRAALEGTDQRG